MNSYVFNFFYFLQILNAAKVNFRFLFTEYGSFLPEFHIFHLGPSGTLKLFACKRSPFLESPFLTIGNSIYPM